MLIAIAIILFALSYFAFQHAGTPRPKAEEQMKEDQGQKDIAAINKATCPDCGSQMEYAEGCVKCHVCGFSECG